MTYCPRCGIKVPEEATHCQRCGTEIIRKPVGSARNGALEHMKFSIEKAKRRPLVFVPAILSSLLSIIGNKLLESWDVFQDLYDELLDFFWAQSDVMPVSYVYEIYGFDWSRLISWIPVALFIISVLTWVSSIASLKISLDAVRDEELDVKTAYMYVFRRLGRFFEAGFYSVAFSVAVILVYVYLFLSDSIGYDLALNLALIFSLVIIGFTVLSAPVFFVMIVENSGLIPALGVTLRFTRQRISSYLGISLFMGLIAVVMSMIYPYIGYFAFVPTVLGNLALIDLYNHYKRDLSI
ncbi:MAG: zinc ribbon domain-containing protein [Candidatus Bathyarchaeota archaeon]|nr:zinc ribbon domain-containing protein [Candidatus Bathyarchaeota archaeon]